MLRKADPSDETAKLAAIDHGFFIPEVVHPFMHIIHASCATQLGYEIKCLKTSSDQNKQDAILKAKMKWIEIAQSIGSYLKQYEALKTDVEQAKITIRTAISIRTASFQPLTQLFIELKAILEEVSKESHVHHFSGTMGYLKAGYQVLSLWSQTPTSQTELAVASISQKLKRFSVEEARSILRLEVEELLNLKLSNANKLS